MKTWKSTMRKAYATSLRLMFLILISVIFLTGYSGAQVTPLTPPVPIITVSPTYLAFGSVLIEANSPRQTFSLTGRYLKSNVVVTAPGGGYTISDNSQMYPPGSTTLTFVPNRGNVDKTIYVMFRPAAERVYLGTVTSTSQGAVTKGVNVTGEGITGSLTVSPSSLAFGGIEIGKFGIMLYKVTGSGLVSDVVITAPNGFLIAPDRIISEPYAQTVRIPLTSGTVCCTIEVKFSPTSGVAYTGNITNVSGKFKKDVVVSGRGITPTPLLAIRPESLHFWDVKVGSSKTLSYSLKGWDLRANINIFSRAGFTVSTKINGTYSTLLSIPRKSGKVDTTIYVKFTPKSPVLYQSYVSNESYGASSELLYVKGLGTNDTVRSSSLESQKLTLKSTSITSVKIYPNPASDQFTILLNQIVPESITVLNWSGRTVLTVDKSLLNNSEIVVQAGQLPKGYYLVNIRTVSTTYSEKLLIEK